MTANGDLKRIIRSRMAKTGESYSAARAQVLRERDDRDAGSAPAGPVDAVIIKVNEKSARIRILDDADEDVTLRCSGAPLLLPGQIASIRIKRRWRHGGHPYASGEILSTRTDIPSLGLEPLALEKWPEMDARRDYEPYPPSDPCYELWHRITEKPRPAFIFDEVAWDPVAAVAKDHDVSPVCDAAELSGSGRDEEARKLLMDVLAIDLRCIDAHAHLGNLEFDRSPETALAHYEIGIAIGELSLGPRFDGFLLWGSIYNRPFLRCLKGRALCRWRLERFEEAAMDLERILWLNPNDNQGARFCLPAVEKRQPWTPNDEWRDDGPSAGGPVPLLN